MHKKNNCKKDKYNSYIPKQRYCGEDLECINVHKGDTYDTALANINEVVCNGGGCNLSVDLIPSDDYEYGFEVSITGGTAPYTYEWSLQQVNCTPGAQITDVNAEYPNVEFTSTDCNDPFQPCFITGENTSMCGIAALHFKLKVIDSNGCIDKDYFTTYVPFVC